MSGMEGSLSQISSITTASSCSDKKQVHEKVENWKGRFDESKLALDERKKQYMPLVNEFYDLVTAFYEFGWGQSFHFAPQKEWESFESSIYRHEYYLAHRLGLGKGKSCLDIGCGVGGPARNIATFSEANIVGINNNEYQIGRAKKLIADAKLSERVTFVQSDFMHMDDIDDESKDAAYSIEATCHAPDKVGVYTEILSKVKPGGYYATYEWVMTDKYDPNDESHVKTKKGIEIGNGIAELLPIREILDALRKAGWEIVDHKNLAYEADEGTPWYKSLSGSFSLSGWKHTKVGRYMTNRLVSVLETIKIAPKGTTEVSNLLMATADDLVKGGQDDIFTPCWFILCRKPTDGDGADEETDD